MKLDVLVVFCLLAVSYGSPLPACGCQTYPCNHEGYPYAINGGQTPEEDPTAYDVRVRQNAAYSYESSYKYPSNEEEDSYEGQGAYGGQSNPNSHSSDRSHQNAPQQATHRSITLTWRFKDGSGGQSGTQRPSTLPNHPQGQSQRPWNPEQTSQPGPSIQPTGQQRPSTSPMMPPMYGHDGAEHRPAVQPIRPQGPPTRLPAYGSDENLQDKQASFPRPTPRHRHHPHGNSWGSEGGNQYGGMSDSQMHIMPYPYNGN